MPVGTPFPKGKSGNPDGRPLGTISLESRIRRILEGEEKLPAAIARTIRSAVGADKHALDAILIVGLLQALQGEEKWAKLLLERGYGKMADRLEGGDPAKPIQHTFTLKIDNS